VLVGKKLKFAGREKLVFVDLVCVVKPRDKLAYSFASVVLSLSPSHFRAALIFPLSRKSYEPMEGGLGT
jgi:hypothetical protein